MMSSLESSPIRLRIWAGAWDLPSADPDSLSVITYSKFMKAPLLLQEVVPSETVTGTLPELQIEESVYNTTSNIFAIFRKEGYNADFNSNSIDQSDTMAYLALIDEKLKPGIIQNFWLNSENYVKVTKPAFSKSFGFLLSYWKLPQMRNKFELDLLYRAPGNSSEREAYFYGEAKICITLLSNRLGNKDFFFGSTPTTFDAVAFSYLSVILKAPLVSTELKNHLTACDNLCKYCGRISQRYFKDDENSIGYAKDDSETTKTKSESASGKANEKRNQVICVAVAVFVNIVYILTTKIIPRSSRSAMTEFVEVEDVLD
ncbi:metaxin-3-like [Styela clava]